VDQAVVAQDRADIFAANRARGHVSLSVAARHGFTRRARVLEEGPLRVRCPGPPSRALDAVIVNTAGGIAGGDILDVDVAVGTGASLTITTAAAEKIYRTLAPEAAIHVHLAVEAGAALTWLPQETILFDRARLRRTIDVDLAEDATLVLAEALVFGRAAMGETVEEGSLFDRWRIRRGGRLVYAETVRLDDAIETRLRERAVTAGGGGIATLFVAPADDARIASVRALTDWRGEAAVSAWNGFALARFVAPDGAALRHDLMATLAALGAAVPRLWLN
jgi:urease accessory protein